jgi:protein-S-isoprenylcysteine O-methyltransferase Ste14
MRIASFNVENLFQRAKALNAATWAEGKPILEKHARINELITGATVNSEQNVVVRKVRAAVGSLVFLVLAPGVVAGVIPWWLTDWRTEQPMWDWLPLRIVGVALIIVGVLVLLEAFARFVVEGLGTPAPVAPTERLVVGGLYRYVRNPMYLAVAATIVGQGLALGRPILLLYAAGFAIAVTAFVHWYEEPTLQRQFGPDYEAYRRAVPGWRPRWKPWNPGTR